MPNKKENKLVLYKDDEGKLSVNTLFADEDVWLTQAQLAEIYQTTQQNVSLHLQGIYEDKELDDESTHKKFLLVRQEGKRQVKREIGTCQGTGHARGQHARGQVPGIIRCLH